MNDHDPLETFAELIQQAQGAPGRDPASRERRAAFDLPGGDRFIDTSEDDEDTGPPPEVEYIAHAEHFVLPRQRAAYEKTLALILNQKALLRYEDRTFNRAGELVVALCYLTYERKESPTPPAPPEPHPRRRR